MKKGLILEGGAMRGMYTAGIMDEFMENGIKFDGIVGTSAGAAFGCNYKSHQIGRVIRYNKRFCGNSKYGSFRSLILSGDMYEGKFCYETIPNELDIFDAKTFAKDPSDFYAVCTDIITGKAIYHKCEKGDSCDLKWIRASASMPLVSRDVKIGNSIYTDGGVADSVAVKFFEKLGYDKKVVILTQPKGYIKKKLKLMPFIKIRYRKYPQFVKAMNERHINYNNIVKYIEDQYSKKNLFLIRPTLLLDVGAMAKDPEKLQKVYDIGRKDGKKKLEEIKEYLNE